MNGFCGACKESIAYNENWSRCHLCTKVICEHCCKQEVELPTEQHQEPLWFCVECIEKEEGE